MFNFLLGLAAAVVVSIVAPDKFAAASQFVRALPGRIVRFVSGV